MKYDWISKKTWVAQTDEKGFNPAEVYWANYRRGAYVALERMDKIHAFVFGNVDSGLRSWVSADGDKPVSAYKVFNDFSTAKVWAEVTYRLFNGD